MWLDRKTLSQLFWVEIAIECEHELLRGKASWSASQQPDELRSRASKIFFRPTGTGSGPSSRRGSLLFDDSRRPSLLINDEVSICQFDTG